MTQLPLPLRAEPRVVVTNAAFGKPRSAAVEMHKALGDQLNGGVA